MQEVQCYVIVVQCRTLFDKYIVQEVLVLDDKVIVWSELVNAQPVQSNLEIRFFGYFLLYLIVLCCQTREISTNNDHKLRTQKS